MIAKLIRRGIAATALTALLAGIGVEAAPLIAVPTPAVSAVSDPGMHGYPFHALPSGTLPAGWRETEYFVAGNTFTTATPLPFKTRILVVRPTNARRFNGKVIVEWLNVTAGNDLAVARAPLMPLMFREGYAYVGVTAQKIGLDPLAHTGNLRLCPPFGGLFCQPWDPARYGTLTHPGDDPGSFDIFSAVGKVLRNPNGVNPFAGLTVDQLIAIGQSQSSGRMRTYSLTIHNVTTAPVYDAFLLVSGATAPTANLPTITVNSENEAASPVPPPLDAPYFRLWEVAGAAHTPIASMDEFKTLLERDYGIFPSGPCQYPMGIQPIPWGVSQYDVVIRSAVVQVSRWAATGTPAVAAPRMDRVAGGLGRDQYGNVTGGIRLPEVEVPIVRHVGRNLPAECSARYGYDAFNGEPAGVPGPEDLWTEPTSPSALYGNHGQYVWKFLEATKNAVQDGFVLPADGIKYILGAAKSDVGKTWKTKYPNHNTDED